MKIVVDGDTCVIMAHVSELLMTAGLAQDGVERRRTHDGGASEHAVRIALELDSGAKRGLASMSDVRQSHPTLEPDQAASEPDSRSRVVSVREAAANHKVDPRTILRWKDRDPSMLITSERPYRLDRDAVDAYASGRPNRRSAA